MLRVATWADIARVSAFGIATEHQTLDDFIDVGALIEGDLLFHPLIAPEIPMIAEDLPEPFMASGATDALE